MKFVYLKIGLIALMLTTTIACGRNKKDDSVAVNGNTERAAGPSNLPTGQSQLSGTQGAAVVGTGMTQAQFDEVIKILVSSTLRPENVGSVNLQNGVQIHGQVAVNHSNGAVVPTSRVQLTIVDSYAASGQAEPIRIIVANASGGASNGTARLVFSDEYGSITVSGTYDASQFRGKVAFANTKGDGYNGKKSGTLGDFVIQTCAFFVCQ